MFFTNERTRMAPNRAAKVAEAVVETAKAKLDAEPSSPSDKKNRTYRFPCIIISWMGEKKSSLLQ